MTTPWGDLATYRQKKRQKFEVYLTKGRQVNPKAYCCDSNTINDAKPPVAILTATPSTIYEGENVTLDLSGSYDPDGGGIADPGGYEIWDGIGGNYPATKTQVVNYPNAGRFEAQGVVTDVTGLMGQASVWVEVLSAPGGDNPPEPPGGWRKKQHILTRAKGVYYTEDFSGPGGGNPTWMPTNGGLDSLVCVQGVPDPWEPAERQFLIAGAAGSRKVYRRIVSVSDDWVPVLTNAEAVALTGSVSGTIHWICGNINRQGYFYVLFNSALTDNGIWCLRTPDYGDNWFPFQIFSGTSNYAAGNIQAGAFKGTSGYPAGDVIYATVCTGAGGYNRIRVSLDNAATWPGNYDWGGVSQWANRVLVDGSDQSIVYAGFNVNGTDLKRSTQHGAGPVEVDGANQLGIALWHGYGTAWVHIWNKNLMRILKDDHIWTTTNYCTTWIDYGITDMHVDIISVVHDSPYNLYLARKESGTIPPGLDQPHVIFVSDDEGQTMEGKAGAHADQADGGGDSIPYNCGGVAEEGIWQIWTED